MYSDRSEQRISQRPRQIPDLRLLDDSLLRAHLRRTIDFKHVSTKEAAEALRDQGYEPVECSFGRFSVVGTLKLDHHGALANEEPVSIKAAKIAMLPGFRPLSKFVLTGLPDGDSVYAVLVLSGQIVPDLKIAAAIAELDLDPIGINRLKGVYIREVAFQMNGVPSHCVRGVEDALVSGVRAFDGRGIPKPIEAQARRFEAERQRLAVADISDRKSDCILVNSDSPGRDVWHKYGSILVQFKPSQRVITVSGCSERAADFLHRRSVYSIFGPTGFDALYPEMDKILGPGSGGRPDIGGSPRGCRYSFEDALKVYELVKARAEASLS